MSVTPLPHDGVTQVSVESAPAREPGVVIQPKGLLATEGVVSVPFEGTHPLAVGSHVIVAHPSFPANSIKELVDHAKAKPGEAYASPAQGTAQHLGMEMVLQHFGLEASHIAYKGSAQAVLLFDEVEDVFPPLSMEASQRMADRKSVV